MRFNAVLCGVISFAILTVATPLQAASGNVELSRREAEPIGKGHLGFGDGGKRSAEAEARSGGGYVGYAEIETREPESDNEVNLKRA